MRLELVDRLGDPSPKLCSKHIGPSRVIVSFPSGFEVAIVKVVRHDDNTDPYVELATEMGLWCRPALTRSPHVATESHRWMALSSVAFTITSIR